MKKDLFIIATVLEIFLSFMLNLKSVLLPQKKLHKSREKS